MRFIHTELIWNEKHKVEIPPPIPFQILEVIEKSEFIESNLGKKSQNKVEDFDSIRSSELSWRNKLIWGENKIVMVSLLKNYKGKINLIYIDPPFASGGIFKYPIQIGKETFNEAKKYSTGIAAYQDSWGQCFDAYLQMMYERLLLMKELLAETGSLYIHLDAHICHYIKVILDEIFGHEAFQREIIWRMGWVSGFKTQVKNWVRNHDTILFYVKNPDNFTFNKKWIPYPKGYERWGGRKKGKGYAIEDIWGVHVGEGVSSLAVISYAKENLGFQTQKPEALLQRIIATSSNPGDLVADFFCGTGTTLVTAEKMGRRWIGCDISGLAIHLTRKRLLDINNSKHLEQKGKVYGKPTAPFIVMYLGKDMRRYWFHKIFPKVTNEEFNEAYYSFMLKLYGAEPITTSTYFQGKLGNAYVYIGGIDATITLENINAIIAECELNRIREVHIIGWDFEESSSEMRALAKKKGILLKLRKISEEIVGSNTSKKKTFYFFELAALEVCHKIEGQDLTLQLEKFSIPHLDFIPETIVRRIQHWSDWIDYWAVDFNYQKNIFHNNWAAYRTRRHRDLPISVQHHYETPGTYTIMLKVIDIFGRVTTTSLKITIPLEK
ncbi:MAG: DNA methyltransferase [Candidatus Helarchaeota archaeon]